MSDSTNALVLPVDRASTSEAQTFPGFPGAFRPGVPVLLSTIGLSLMEARAMISDLGLPLVEQSHDGDEEAPVPDENPPRHEGDAAFDDGLGAPEQPTDTVEAEAPPLDRLTKPQLVAHAAALDPPLTLDEADKKDDLLAAIAAQGLPPAVTPPPEPPHEAGETDGGNL